MRYEDLMSLPSDTVRKAEIRKRVGAVIYNALNDEFGEDFVRFLAHDLFIGENASKIPNGTLIADVGDITNKAKCLMGALVEISIKVKQWDDCRTAKTDRAAVTLDDVDEAIKISDELAATKAEKAKRDEQAKQAKIAKDTERRKKE